MRPRFVDQTQEEQSACAEMGDMWEEWEGAHEFASGPLMEMFNDHPREYVQ